MDNNVTIGDHIITAIAASGFVRICAAESTDTVQKAVDIHGTSGVATAALGRALTAASLMSSQLKNKTDSIILQIKGKGPLGGIVCVSDVNGNVRGYVNNPTCELPLRVSDGKLDVGKAVGPGYLQVIKDLSLKEPYVGTSALLTGEIAEDVAYYFSKSEQVPSVVSLGVRIMPDPMGKKPFVVEKAGGFLLQLMPGAPESIIDDIEKNISCLPSITTLLGAGATITNILEDVTRGYDLEIKDVRNFGYVCGCSRERTFAALAAIGKKDLEEILKDGKGAELSCHFCNNKYFFSNEDIKSLLDN